MQHSYLRGSLLLALALILGFALMGFEMLGSRYLYPYFGGGINTWASLIATVLVALMLGYLLGGALVDRTMSPRLCGALLQSPASISSPSRCGSIRCSPGC